ncbi:MAG: insulinase family protein [Clostridia bacterium]|nr:insulinase family protein [Clostridia bacterium]
MVKYKKYPNGLNLIVCEGGAISCSFSIMIGTGSINETDKQNGISHYIEHMNFKGNKTYTSYDISDIMESNGANFNAYTSLETTCFYAQTIVDSLEKTFSVMAESTFNSIYPDDEAEKEKGVIIEEINMSEDSPDDVCYDLIMKAYYGEDGYGRTILGSKENVSSFDKKAVFDYLKDFYVAENTVISFAGNVTLERADYLVQKYVLPIINQGKKVKTPKHNTNCLRQNLVKIKDIEQAHIALAFETYPYGDINRVKNEVAVGVLGGGMSSRLFRKVREEMGLAYSVYSFASRYKTAGSVSVYAGVNLSEYKSAFQAILDVINELKRNGVTQSEVEKVKTQLKASTVYSQERPLGLSQFYASHYLKTGTIYDFNERIKQIESVSLDDVNKEFEKFNSLDISTAVVGKNVEKLN